MAKQKAISKELRAIIGKTENQWQGIRNNEWQNLKMCYHSFGRQIDL